MSILNSLGSLLSGAARLAGRFPVPKGMLPGGVVQSLGQLIKRFNLPGKRGLAARKRVAQHGLQQLFGNVGLPAPTGAGTGAMGQVGGAFNAVVSGGSALAGAAIGGTAGAALGPAGAVVGAFAVALTKSIDRIQEWSRALHSANMQFADFSPAMSRLKAETEMQQIFLSRDRGERREPTARYLAEGMMDLETQTSKVGDFFDSLKNLAGGALSRGAAKVTKPFADFSEGAQDALNKKMEGRDPKFKELSVDDYFRGLGVTTPPEFYGRPGRFGKR